jgi:hypothetical protein
LLSPNNFYTNRPEKAPFGSRRSNALIRIAARPPMAKAEIGGVTDAQRLNLRRKIASRSFEMKH